MSTPKNILIAPLDWGLGHASRCIPLIYDYLQKNNNVIVGGTKETNDLIVGEFPELRYVEIPGYAIEYDFSDGNEKSQLPVIVKQIPKILKAIKREHLWLKEFASKQPLDLIISDNRYGMWHKDIKSIFITHQLFLQTPWRFVDFHRFILHLTRNFNSIWIPDFKDTVNNLSGDLSHKKPLPSARFKFIGPLSRFSINHTAKTVNPAYDYIAIASGPKEQREMFAQKIIEKAQVNKSEKGILVLGEIHSKDELSKPLPNLEIYNHLPANEFKIKLLQSRKVIAACGYSTIMDLFVLDKLKDAELFPVKGQTEQEYLYSHLQKYFYKND